LLPAWLLSAARLSSTPSWELEQLVVQAQRVRFLVLDDLGAETLTKHVTGALFEILDARWTWQKRTVISANVLPGELHRRLDWEGKEAPANQEGRIWRRIAEHWVATVSRASGVLHVRREEERFPTFEAPGQRQRGGGR
jgi:DNA replication protein DnaC